ncbi:MAG TPA: M1 family metallopeptidase [Kofleriaceae bacterium]|jgi:aminopeptidase N|nr:M1 family metallopeptidase [Kofleriaceae bacterium]
MRAGLLRAGLLVVLAACSSAERARPVSATPPAPRPAPAAAVPDPPPPELRLPGDVRPTRYALELTIVPEQPPVAGRVHIAAEVVRPARIVWLHASGLAIARAEIDGAPARVITGASDVIGVTLDRPLAPGRLAIDLAFTAPIDRERSRGIYSEREGSDSYVYTFFEPVDARRAFPCFDEPSYKVPWQLTFHVKADHVALGNAPVERETAEPGGMKRVELAATRPLPSYLVAFVVGPFELIDGGTAGRIATPIRFVIPRGRAGELGYAREVTPRVVAALEEYFDMPYPYGKLDVAVVPRYWGTMEHPGIVAMGQPLTLIRPDQATRRRKRSYATILAHELSHYWFGDLVTMAWWDDTWLNEALGQWSDMNITEAAEPTWRVRDARIDLAARAMASDETLASHAIRQPVTTRSGIQVSFDNEITYYKGSSVFRMFESSVGPKVWQRFIQAYLRAHAWGNASADDFLHDAADQLGPPVAAALRGFLERPGVPRIAAELRCPAGAPPRVELTQQRSLPAGVADPAPAPWTVPVCIRSGTAAASFRDCVTLSTATASFALGAAGEARGCPSWLMLNADGVGYYRSGVDPAMARALLTPSTAIARTAAPTPAERMMLVEDLRAAVARGELAIDRLLDLVPVIAADPDPKVARSAVDAAAIPFAGLDDAMERAARAWESRAFAARARQLGWQRGAHDSEELHELRQAIVPRVARHDPALTAEATRLADRWLADRTGIADDLAASALAVAARHGDAARFDRYLAAARTARDRNEHGRLLTALGEFTDPALADRGLALVLGHDLDLRESIWILYGVLDHRETRDRALAFLATHLDELIARMRSDDAAGFLTSLAGKFCDPDRRAQVAQLAVGRAEQVDGAPAHVARALERADQCIARVQRELPALRRMLGAAPAPRAPRPASAR